MKKLISVLLILLSIKICAFASEQNLTMDTIIDSWKGCSIDAVIDRWGYPSEEKIIAGHKLYIWRGERTVTTNEQKTVKHRDNRGRVYYTTTISPKNTQTYTTERILEADFNNNVIKGQYSGNDLPFSFIGVGKDWLNPAYRISQ